MTKNAHISQLLFSRSGTTIVHGMGRMKIFTAVCFLGDLFFWGVNRRTFYKKKNEQVTKKRRQKNDDITV